MLPTKCRLFSKRAQGATRFGAWVNVLVACILMGACSEAADSANSGDGWAISSHDGERVCGEPNHDLRYSGPGMEEPEERLPEDCDVFRGEINVSPLEWTDLSLLPDLRVIEGPLRVTYGQVLESLHGLERLEEVGGGLTISNNRLLADISGLSSLRQVGFNFWLTDNPALSDLRGLQNLQMVEEDLIIENNDGLESLAGLAGLETIGERLYIGKNQRLADMSALSGLQQIGGMLVILENERLEELHGLENIRSVSRLALKDNPSLQSLEGLSGLREVQGDVVIWGSPDLSSAEIEAFVERVDIGGEIRFAPPENN